MFFNSGKLIETFKDFLSSVLSSCSLRKLSFKIIKVKPTVEVLDKNQGGPETYTDVPKVELEISTPLQIEVLNEISA